MNFRLTAILFSVILMLGLVLLGITLIEDKDAVSTDVLMEELAKIGAKTEQIDAVQIERPGAGMLKIVRASPEKWEIQEPVKATADRFAVEGLIAALLKVKPTAHGELTNSLAFHGLEPPSLKVTFRSGDTSSTVNVGHVTVGGSRAVAFVSTSARPKRPMAVPASELSSLFRDSSASGQAGDLARWTSDFRTKNVFSTDARGSETDVTSLVLSNKDKRLALSRKDKGWMFDSPAGWGGADAAGDPNPAATGITGVDPLLTALTSMQALGTDDFIEAPKDLKEYGLNADNPDLVRVELKAKDAPPQVVFIGKRADAPPPPTPGAPPAPSNKWYVRVEGEQGVIRANAGKLDGLVSIIAEPNPLRDRTLFAFDKSRVDAIDIMFEGQAVKLRKSGAVLQWKLWGQPHDPTVANTKVIEDILGALFERRTIRDFPAPNDANFAAPELKVELKLWADGIDSAASADAKAEPKLKGNPITLLFGRKEADKFYVRRTLADGSKADFTLPERVTVGAGAVPVAIELVPALRKDRLALLDPTLHTFSPFSVSKLTIQQGQNVTELDRAEDASSPVVGKWTYAKPDAQKGRTADGETIQNELLGLLSQQRAARFVKESATDAELAGWGLDPKNPRMKLTVELRTSDPDKERAFFLGNDTGDGNVFAKQADRPAVFALPKLVFDKFATADLRDKTVVRFDRTKVKGVRVRGWKESSGSMQVMEFEKKGADWSVKSPAGYALDAGKLVTLIGAIDGMRANTFEAGGQKPEHRFAPETASGLEVTIELDGAPAVSVNLGAETPDKTAYYAWSSTLPAAEAVFTTPAELFRPFKASAGSLSRTGP